ncbi:MAG TPA: ABC transporter substrate-binding protein, partial [Stellaceae bacterium]|nr:ABC transporter substrate-binding protein [Stellaceae bacterium]
MGQLQLNIPRRTILKAGVAAGALQVAAPFIVKAQGEQPVKIGVDNPLTGIYTALGKNENFGMQLAADQINAKGGILGRKVELVIE